MPYNTKRKKKQGRITEISSFTIATNSIKHLGITLNKEVKDLFEKTFKSLMKEIQEDTRKWKALPCSWIGRINIVKMAILPKQSIDSMQSPSKVITDLERTIINFLWKNKKKKPERQNNLIQQRNFWWYNHP